MRKISFILLVLAACQPVRDAQPLIPVTPAWALGHIVWEDEFNTRDSLFGLIRQYQSRDIPVDGVIIDSPWTTSYNDFIWDTARYPDPQEMTARLLVDCPAGYRSGGYRFRLHAVPVRRGCPYALHRRRRKTREDPF